MHCLLYTNLMRVIPRNNVLRKQIMLFDWKFQLMILYRAVNLDWKSEYYMVQILPINICCHLQCLKISYRLQFLVNTLTELMQEKM